MAMRIVKLLPILFCIPIANAQWSMDPTSPMRPCPSQIFRKQLASVGDAEGNWYLFWTEAREGPDSERVYGQKLNAQGYPQWEANGREIYSHPTNRITQIQVARVSDERIFVVSLPAFFVGSDLYNDTLWVTALNNDGEPAWGGHVPMRSDPDTVRWVQDLNLIADDQGGAFVSWKVRPGGSNLEHLAMNRITSAGAWAWGSNALTIPDTEMILLTAYRHVLARDGEDGVYVAWSRHLTGSPVRLQRFAGDGEAIWPALEVSAGATGTGSIADRLNMVEDGDGGVVLLWGDAVDTSTGDLFVARVDDSGDRVWSPPVKPLCMATGLQRRAHIARSDGHLFFVWEDWRSSPSTSATYVQRLNMDGGPVWDTDGSEVPLESWPNTTPHMVATSSGGGIIVVANGPSARYHAQRIALDGSTPWPSHHVMAVQGLGNTAGSRTVHPDQAGGAVTFWTNGNSLFGASVTDQGAPGSTVGIQEQQPLTPLSAWPVPTVDVLYMRLPTAHYVDVITVYKVDGRTVQVPFTGVGGDVFQLDLTTLSPGVYAAQVLVDAKRYHARFVKE